MVSISQKIAMKNVMILSNTQWFAASCDLGKFTLDMDTEFVLFLYASLLRHSMNSNANAFEFFKLDLSLKSDTSSNNLLMLYLQ